MISFLGKNAIMFFKQPFFNQKIMEKEIERLYKKIWETKGCRFIAAKKLEDIEKWSSLTINIFSIYIIIVNLTVLLKTRPNFLSDSFITFLTISLSILILVISNIINSREYKLKAKEHHICGRELSELYDKLCQFRNGVFTPTSYDIRLITNEFHKILEKFDLNHTTLDYNYFKLQNISEYSKIKNKRWFMFRVWIDFKYQSIIKYIMIMTVPLIIILYLIICSAPNNA